MPWILYNILVLKLFIDRSQCTMFSSFLKSTRIPQVLQSLSKVFPQRPMMRLYFWSPQDWWCLYLMVWNQSSQTGSLILIVSCIHLTSSSAIILWLVWLTNQIINSFNCFYFLVEGKKKNSIQTINSARSAVRNEIEDLKNRLKLSRETIELFKNRLLEAQEITIDDSPSPSASSSPSAAIPGPSGSGTPSTIPASVMMPPPAAPVTPKIEPSFSGSPF